MEQEIVYGFILDGSPLLKGKLSTGISSLADRDQGIGALVGESANYLINKAYLNDNRSKRNLIDNVYAPLERLEVVYDKDRTTTMFINNLTSIQQMELFNIVEHCYTQDTAANSALETKLTDYQYYVPNSFNRSTETVSAALYCNSTDVSNYAKTMVFANWIEFEYKTEDADIVFHLWISNIAFNKQYPYVTITSVIAPCDLNTLVDPAVVLNSAVLDMLSSSTKYVFGKTNIEAVLRDQNGIYTFTTKYVLDSRTKINIPFALPYCGARTPSTLDCRKAIREYLEENTTKPAEELKIIFPELYVSSRFYMIPMYDKYTARAGKDYYADIWNVMDIRRLANKFYADVEDDYIDQYLEILTNAQNNMLTVALPDTNNEQFFSILEQHPTYQDYATHESGFKYLDGSTQEFASKLTEVMAIVNGVLSSDEYQFTESSGYNYIAFAQDESEYLVMTRESYTELISNV